MNVELTKFAMPLLAALAFAAGCRETQELGPKLPSAAGSAAGAAAGMGAGGATAGMSATAGTGAMAGTGAAPAGSAVATIAGFMGGMVTGSATFTKATGTDVKVTVAISNCVAGKSYPVHIHEGTSCADAMMQGDHWGPARGEGIPSVMCVGTTGTSTLTRPAIPANLAWTIGGDVMTNVVGHAFVVHDPDVATMPPRIACGLIMQR
ncbi:MAG TPA: superoxide dismutase family protein [Polyangiales bacterium]|nr:superoxide dismutase family protein [Polyangiales bacterium]